LFQAFTSGQNWSVFCDALFFAGWIYGALFIVFQMFLLLGLMNVVAAIFVESAMESQRHFKDLLVYDSARKREMYMSHLKEVFHLIDVDGGGTLSANELEWFLEDVDIQAYLASLDIPPTDARSLFELLDKDASGEVDIDEFCEGCLRLKGEAKSFDIHKVLKSNNDLKSQIMSLTTFVHSQARINGQSYFAQQEAEVMIQEYNSLKTRGPSASQRGSAARLPKSMSRKGVTQHQDEKNGDE